MSKKLEINKELKSVAGGSCTEDKITCPNCGQSFEKDHVKTGSSKDGCIIITYYRCPNCKEEWHD